MGVNSDVAIAVIGGAQGVVASNTPIALISATGQLVAGVVSSVSPVAGALVVNQVALQVTLLKISVDIETSGEVDLGDVVSIVGNGISLIGAVATIAPLGQGIGVSAQGLGRVLSLLGIAIGELEIKISVPQLFENIRIRPERDPLAIDLDGDGIETVGLPAGQAPILFDHDADGIKTGTGWLKGDDAWLVLDRNGNGVIDSGQELFGADTIITTRDRVPGTSDYRDVTRFAYNGFEALRGLDSSLDGSFDKSDEFFPKVQLWQDFNQDGVSQANELSSLADKNITKINLLPSTGTTALGNGNSISGTAEVVRSVGTSTHIDSVSLVSSANNLNLATSEFFRTFEPIPVTDAAQGLPDMGGSGWVRDLREAMSLGNAASGALADVISRFAAAKTREAQMGVLDELLKKWALSSSRVSALDLITPVKEVVVADSGLTRQIRVTTLDPGELLVQPMYPAMRLAFDEQKYMDAPLGDKPSGGLTFEAYIILDKLSVVEVFTGQRYVDSTSSRYVGPALGAGGGSSGGGGSAAQLTGPDIRYSSILWAEHVSAIEKSYEALRENVYSALVVQTRLQPYLNSVRLLIDDAGIRIDNDQLINKLQLAYASDAKTALTDLVELNRYAQSTLSAVRFDGVSMLRQWVEVIPRGSELDQTLSELNVFKNKSDIYYLTAVDDIFFGDDNRSSVSMDAGNDLADGGDADDLFSGGDGQDTIRGQYGYDTIYGGAGDDVLLGGGNPDRLFGDSGNDTLDGGTGNDNMFGGSGADTYLFGFGDGNDGISNGDSDAIGELADVLQFKDGVETSDVTLRRQVDDLLVIVGTGGKDNIRVFQHFGQDGGSTNRLDAIQFADGTRWDVSEIRARTLISTDFSDAITGHASDDVMNGGAGRDSLVGGTGNDTLDGGRGNDLLTGGNGSDVYLFGLGSGKDTISNQDEDALWVNTNTIRFGPGINPEDLSLKQVDENLVIQVLGTDDQLTISGYLRQEPGSNLIENMVFDTGETWSIDAVKTIVLAGTTRADQLRAYNGATEIHGGEGRDSITGGRFNDSLEGGADSDKIWGGNGDDTLDGGNGNDTLAGENGADVYMFGRGSGRDYLDSDGGGLSQDTLAFKPGIKPEDISIAEAGNDIVFKIIGTSDQISVAYYNYEPLKAITFTDGTSWSPADIRSKTSKSTDGADKLSSFYADGALSGGGGNDTLGGTEDLKDTLQGDSGNDALDGYGQADSLSGGAGHDQVRGGRGNDVLSGDQGNDSLWGDEGNDTLDGGSGEDWLSGGGGSDTYVFTRGSGQDTIVNNKYDAPESNPDTISIGNGLLFKDLTFLRKGADLLIQVNDTSDQLTVESHFVRPNTYTYSAIDIIKFSDGTTLNIVDIERLALTAPGNLNLLGGVQDDSLTGTGGNDNIQGQDGADSLDGGKGNDYLIGGNGNDVYLFGKGSGQDTVNSYDAAPGKTDLVVIKSGTLPQEVKIVRSLDNLEISITGTSDRLIVQDHFADWSGTSGQISQIKFSDNTVWDLAIIKAKALASTSGDDMLHGSGANDTLSGSAGDDFLSGMSGNDVLWGDSGNDTIQGEVGNDDIHGGEQYDHLEGGEGNDTLYGDDGNDTLMGGGEDDVLDGGAGNDLLDGGAGNDTYRFTRGSGNDTINPGYYDLDVIEFSTGIKPSDLVLTRQGNNGLLIRVAEAPDTLFLSQYFGGYAPSGQLFKFSDGTVWAAEDIMRKSLMGSELPDELIGFSTDDTINGGAEGDDIDGKDGNDLLRGEAGSDYLFGNNGNDTLEGGVGDDTLSGGTGSDVYRFDLGSGNDVIRDSKGSDTNVVELGPNILAIDTQIRQDVSGSLLMTFAKSPDTLLVSSDRIDQIRFSDQTVWDEATIKSKTFLPTDRNDAIRGYALADFLRGGEGDDSLYGNAGSDSLDGGAGDDLLDGGLGQDIYYFNIGSGQDTISERSVDKANPDVIRLGSGISAANVSMVRSGVDAKLSIQGAADVLRISSFFSAYSNVSNAVLSRIEFFDGEIWGQKEINQRFLMAGGGSDDISVAAGDNSITGSDDNDRITSGNGNDTIRGGLGKDLIYGGSGSDQLWGGRMDDELRGESGNDLLYGERGNDYLYGDLGQDGLDGGVGNDLLNGGSGADTYFFSVGSGADTISDVDVSSGVSDVIEFDMTPAALKSIERLGNNMVLSYGSGDVLTVSGQFGGDASEIEQLVFSDGTTWAEAEIKARVITKGGDLSDTITGYNDGTNRINGLGGKDLITGGAMADTLDGGAGLDTLIGGSGDDRYLVDMTLDSLGDEQPDMVLEYSGVAGGNDTAVVTGAGYILPDNVENLVMTGKAGIMSGKSGKVGIGNSAANQITGFSESDLLQGLGGNDTLVGRSGNDTLDGGLGMDSLVGDAGNDTFILKPEYDQQGLYVGFDTISEVATADGGIDTVESYVEGYALAPGLENLQVKTYSGFGNELDNVLTGTDANNRLVGGAGNDTLDAQGGNDLLEGGLGNDVLNGGAGTDTMLGGAGDDTYQWGVGSGQDRINDAAGSDVVALSAGVAAEQVWLSKAGDDLLVTLLGSNDVLAVESWFTNANQRVETFRLSDGRQLQDAKVQALVEAMSRLPAAANADVLSSNASYANVKSLVASSWV